MTSAASVERLESFQRIDMKELNVIEDIIPEYGMADEDALTSISSYMKGHMKEFLKKMNEKSIETIVEERYTRFRKF